MASITYKRKRSEQILGNEDEFERFSELPAEMQEKILDEVPEMAITLSRVSRNLYNRSKRCYLSGPGNYYTSPSEIEKYVLQSPPHIAVFNSVEAHGYIYTPHIVSGFTRHNVIVLAALPNALHYTINETDHAVVSAELVIKQLTESSLLDILGYYRILGDRLGCMVRNPAYAATSTMSMLEKVYNCYLADKNNITNIFVNHMYLYMSCYIVEGGPLIPFNNILILNSDTPLDKSSEYLKNRIKGYQDEIEHMYIYLRACVTMKT